MLEYLAIFTRGGALLWTFGQLLNIKGDPINALIRNCLLEDRIGEGGYIYRPTGGTPYTLKWTFHNVRSRCLLQCQHNRPYELSQSSDSALTSCQFVAGP